LRYICFVGGAEVLIVMKTGRPQPQDFRPGLVGTAGRGGSWVVGPGGGRRGRWLCRRVRAEQLIDVDVRRIDGWARLRCCAAQAHSEADRLAKIKATQTRKLIYM
jgi:hypothetical protein